jgi:hypothetical protein
MNRAKVIAVVAMLAIAGVLAGAGAAAYLATPTGMVFSDALADIAHRAAASPIPTTLSTPIPAAAPATPGTAAERFETWIEGPGGTLLENSLAVLYQAEADAKAGNIDALEAEGNALVTSADTSLDDPPPAHAASWNAAFAAMVQAGGDLAAGNLAAAEAESTMVQRGIRTFNSQISRAG